MPSLFFLMFLVAAVVVWNEYPERQEALKACAAGLVGLVALRGAWEWAKERARDARHARRHERLHALAASLHQGTVEGRGFYRGGIASVGGALDGFKVRLALELGDAPTAAYEVRVPNSLVELDVRGAGALDRLLAERGGAASLPAGSWISAGSSAAAGASGPGAGACGPLAELTSLVRALVLGERRFVRVTLGPGLLRAERSLSDADLVPARALADLRALLAVAQLCGRQEVRVRSLRAACFGWTAGTRDVRCPRCRVPFARDAEDLVACGACRTAHHRECLREAQGCTVLGCPGVRAPARARAHAQTGTTTTTRF